MFCLHFPEKRFHIVDGHSIVCVHEQTKSTLARQHAFLHGESFSAVVFKLEHANVAKFAREFPCSLGGRILAAISDDYNLASVCLSFEKIDYQRQSARK